MRQYYVSVVGRGAPSMPHVSLSSAKQEAERLANKPENKNHIIHVFALVGQLDPVKTPSHEWHDFHANQPF